MEQQTQSIKGEVKAKSIRNYGLMIDATWYNAVTDTAKDKLQTIEKGDKCELIVTNIKDIVDILNIHKQTLEDIMPRINEKIELLVVCKGEIEKRFTETERYPDLAPLVAILFRAIGGDK